MRPRGFTPRRYSVELVGEVDSAQLVMDELSNVPRQVIVAAMNENWQQDHVICVFMTVTYHKGTPKKAFSRLPLPGLSSRFPFRSLIEIFRGSDLHDKRAST